MRTQGTRQRSAICQQRPENTGGTPAASPTGTRRDESQELSRPSARLLGRPVRSFLAPDLLILDDLGLHRLTAQQSIDLYELVIGRHRSSSFVITSNRAVEEWLGLFDDPILCNSALDRLANASYQIVIEGESYRQRLSPHRALLESQKGGD